MTVLQCAACEAVIDVAELKPLDANWLTRTKAGEIIPNGLCPHCMGFVYEEEQETTCEKCKKTGKCTETVEILTERDPDVYEEQEWCYDCLSRHEYENAPGVEEYERARANGWED